MCMNFHLHDLGLQQHLFSLHKTVSGTSGPEARQQLQSDTLAVESVGPQDEEQCYRAGWDHLLNRD